MRRSQIKQKVVPSLPGVVKPGHYGLGEPITRNSIQGVFSASISEMGTSSASDPGIISRIWRQSTRIQNPFKRSVMTDSGFPRPAR
ncbi:hypothetical protein HPP92_028946 [Vanilla planifolia]|uniref:Uncharacterized protein n=1 Tax=Vanilla planifolia TaxID=51239 RepID=A0A835U2A2_VANPL|nr:hypothetical protein HPP92_028936 [Vanilla planifolia]KAG0446243.1 hypothetical protein HPP92_028946 [Vanilla planifolia]